MSLRRNTPRAANGVGASRADWGERNSSTPKSSNHGGGVGSGSFSIKAGNDSQRSSTDSQRSSSSNAKDDDDEDGRKPVPAKWSYRMPEDASYCDYLAYPYRSASAWMRLLCDNFGWRFIAMIVPGEHFLKGVLGSSGGGGLATAVFFYILRSMGVSGADFTALVGAASSPWALKPILGFVNEALPIYGYKSRFYVIFLGVVATIAYALLALSSSDGSTPEIVSFLFFLASLQISWTDLMVEGVYTAKMAQRPRYAPDLLSWVWSGINLSSLAGVALAGPLIDAIGPFKTVIVAIPFALSVVPPAMMGWMCEKREPEPMRSHCFALNRKALASKTNRGFFVTASVLGVASLICTVCSVVLEDANTKFAIVAVSATIAVLTACFTLPKPVALALLYFFTAHVLSLYPSGPVFLFYTDTPDVCPDCPHFSATFFTTAVGIVDAVFGALGVMIFNTFMKSWSFRNALIVTQILAVVTSLVDIVQFNRWVSGPGKPVPDWLLMLGKCAFNNTTAMLHFMPGSILISRMCPKGIETLSFALLAGYCNFGSSVAAYVSAYILSAFPTLANVNGSGTDDFSDLWKVSLMSTLLPLLIILLIPVLVPAGRMDENQPSHGAAGDVGANVLAVDDGEDDSAGDDGDKAESVKSGGEVEMNEHQGGEPRLGTLSVKV